MVVGIRIAYPQPLAKTCCSHVGPVVAARAAGKRRAIAARNSGLNPNSMMTGTGPGALAGVVNVSWISTLTRGYDELSTRPMSFLVIAGTSPTVSCATFASSQFTFGVLLGARP